MRRSRLKIFLLYFAPQFSVYTKFGIDPYGDSILNILLFDRTTRRNIIWGTSDYESLGNAYRSQFPITINLITGDNKDIIQPRIYKEKVSQFIRTKDTTLQLHSIESTVAVWLSFLC